MSKLYTTEQFWQVYETLPEEIQNALWAPETGDNIADIITKNSLDKHHNAIVDLCGQVFIGLSLPQDLATELEKLGISPETAKVAARQLNGLVFYPAKLGLEKLHSQVGTKEGEKKEVEIPTPRHSEPRPQQEAPQETDEYMAENEEETSEKSQKPKEVFSEEQGKEDPYREKAE